MAEDPNVLGAKLIKAELMGDEELVKSLKERLEKARQQAAEKGGNNPKPSSSASAQNQHQHHQKPHHHKSGHNQRSFDTNRLDDVESNIFKKNYKFKATNDEYDDLGPAKEKNKKLKRHDNRFESNESKNESTSNRQKEKDMKTSDKCELCYENAQKHLIVSIGKHCYLRLPSDQSLVEGECMIVPTTHCKSSITCDEEVLSEIKDFKRALIKMYDAKRMECVFIEQFMDNKYEHLCIECIPLGKNVSDMGPIYFKKAILESESEWAQNKTLVTLKDQDIRKMIPKSMPYFAVNFGLTEGFAHVIENSEAFPPHFAKEIIGGILDLDPFLWRRPQKEDFSHQSRKVIEFLKWWKSYEFNKK